MKRENVTLIASVAVGIVAVCIIFTVFVERIFPVIAPFLIAFIIALVCDLPSEVIASKAKIPKSLVRLGLAVLTSALLFTITGVFLYFAVDFLIGVIGGLLSGDKLSSFTGVLGMSTGIFGDAFPEQIVEGIKTSLEVTLSAILGKLGEALTSLVGGIPAVMLFLLVGLISLVYFSLDLDRVKGIIKRILPESSSNLLTKLKARIFTVGRKYIVSYLIILGVTYLTLLLGLFVLRVERAALVALFIAILDILPVLGVGTVLIPWSIIAFAMGNSFHGVGLIILFLVNTVIRQIVEPKLVGKTLSLHPLMTLMMIYVGYALFGGIGLIALPTLAVILVSLFKKDDAAEIG